jgi:hypothetical protein
MKKNDKIGKEKEDNKSRTTTLLMMASNPKLMILKS